jgi:hypothetical protein
MLGAKSAAPYSRASSVTTSITKPMAGPASSPTPRYRAANSGPVERHPGLPTENHFKSNSYFIFDESELAREGDLSGKKLRGSPGPFASKLAPTGPPFAA